MRGRAATGGLMVTAVAAVIASLNHSIQAAAGDRALGEYLSSECVTCHQLSGQDQPGIPSIIGMPEGRLAAALIEYKDKKRNNPVMQIIAGKFSNDEIAALATYFGSLKSRR
jgi:cytochrome c553